MPQAESPGAAPAHAPRRVLANRPGGYHRPMTSVHLLHAGYTGDRTASSIVLVRDGDAIIVADPGMVARRSLILDPLAALGIVPEAVTHVFLSHHHPDHTMNVALFPQAEVVGVDGARHLWVGERAVTRVLTEIVARVAPDRAPLPTHWDGDYELADL